MPELFCYGSVTSPVFALSFRLIFLTLHAFYKITMDRIFIPLYRFLKRHRALMYFLMIASSLVFLYYGTKIVFIEDITKLLPQEGPASKSSLVFGDLKVKDMVMLQVTSEGKTGAELAEISDEFVEQLKQADVARAK